MDSSGSIRREGPDHREPRGMTLLDASALVVGFAAVFALVSQTPELAGVGTDAGPPWNVPFRAILLLGLPFGAAIAVVVLVRRLAHGGITRPAEWLTLALGLTFLVQAFPDSEVALPAFWRAVTPGLVDFRAAERAWGLAGLVAVLTGWALFARLRASLPTRVTSLWLIALLGLALWWPLAVLSRTVPQLIWLFYDAPIVSSSWPFWFDNALFEALGRLPIGLVYGTILAAALREYPEPARSRWTWPEWAGVATALLVLPCWFLLDSERTGAWREAFFMPMAWAAVVGLASWWLAGRLVTTWSPAGVSTYDRGATA